jgi:serpin B
MVYAGARGETESQMADVLHYLPQEGQHPTANALQQRTAELGRDDQTLDGGDPFELHIANAIWGQRDYPFREAYLETLARHYGAGLRTIDFAADPDAARERVNEWIAEQTADRIKDMVPPNVIDAATRLVLANAIYFRASWLYPFDREGTEEGPFEVLDGSEISVPLMHRDTVRMPYAEGEGYQAAMIPYDGGTVDMVVILPEPGRFGEIEQELSAEFFNIIRDQAQVHDVALTMPRFDFETDLPLGRRLQEMGMTDAFSLADADFGGIVEGGGLYISAALHKANITTDEAGTEAAAATVVAMRESAMERAELSLDRPFILAITDNELGLILFLGRVVNPAE